jgi:GTP-binding protein YchF
MNVGLVGVPASGKSTLFNALTKGHAETGRFGSGRAEINRGHIEVPDARLDWIADVFQPKKRTYATIDFLDLPGISPGSTAKGSAAQIADLRNVDALLHVVRAFEDPAVPHPGGSVDPVRDMNDLEAELIVADLGVVEKRLARIESDLGKGVDREALGEERGMLEPLQSALEDGKPLRGLGIDPDVQHKLRGYAFLTLKPVILVANVAEEEADGAESAAALSRLAEKMGLAHLAISAKIEAEIDQMDDEEAAVFRKELGLGEGSRERVIRAAFGVLSLISFFTFAGDECRMWTIPRGSHAVEAAGKIHTDMARGFIRAEVVAYDHLRAAGSWAAARETGHYRLEGKDYVMQDGDCVMFRFNV